MVSSDGKKENYKARKTVMVWETLLDCRCSHVRHEEGCDGDGNDARAAYESQGWATEWNQWELKEEQLEKVE